MRGAATLRARFHKEINCSTLTGDTKDADASSSVLAFISHGGDLLKRTRKGGHTKLTKIIYKMVAKYFFWH